MMDTNLAPHYSLEQALWLRTQDKKGIEKEQLPLLKMHLQRAFQVPFYRELFKDKGFEVSLTEEQ